MNLRKIVAAVAALVCLVTPAFAQTEIKPGKAVNISIKGVPVEEQQKIDGPYSVTDTGVVNMPYIGAIRAAGLRPGELAAAIQATYKSQGIYRNPTIQVFASSVDTLEKPMVTVGGQVRRPGPVEYTQGLTLYQAIQAAGGATEFGTVTRIVLYRGGKSQRYNVEQEQFKRIPLEPSDTIEVPQKNIIGR